MRRASRLQPVDTILAAVRRRRHSPLWWSVVALVALLLVLLGRSAAAQSARGAELIERALAAKPNERHGAVLYKQACLSCHGRRALGHPETVTPSLAGQLEPYLIKELADFAEEDRSPLEMHRVVALKAVYSPQSIRDVATYLSQLPRNPAPETGDGRHLDIGKRYYQGLCAFCHGSQGEGNVAHATPALQRQHYAYLVVQMRRLALGHRYSVDLSVMEVLEALPFDYLTAVADYASRLPAGSEDPANEPIATPDPPASVE